MAADIPTTEPRRIVAGDTLQWRIALTDYPAGEGWTLKYHAFNATSSFDIVSAADGDVHAVNVAAAVSALYTPGDYHLSAYVVGGGAHAGERYSLSVSTLEVVANLASGTLDGRTTARQILDSLKSLYQTHITSGRALTDSYTIEGRAFKFVNAADLLKQISYWEQEALREDAAAGIYKRRRALVRFIR